MIRALASVALGKRRELCCPECGGAIVLADWRYWCDGTVARGEHGSSCGFVTATLGTLARRP